MIKYSKSLGQEILPTHFVKIPTNFKKVRGVTPPPPLGTPLLINCVGILPPCQSANVIVNIDQTKKKGLRLPVYM